MTMTDLRDMSGQAWRGLKSAHSSATDGAKELYNTASDGAKDLYDTAMDYPKTSAAFIGGAVAAAAVIWALQRYAFRKARRPAVARARVRAGTHSRKPARRARQAVTS